MHQMQSNTQVNQQLAQCEQLIQQLAQQTQQASRQYQQLLQQEQQNAIQLEQLAQREKHAAQVIQTALQGHLTAMQQLQQISGICNQIANSASHQIPAFTNTYNQSTGYSNYSQH